MVLMVEEEYLTLSRTCGVVEEGKDGGGLWPAFSRPSVKADGDIIGKESGDFISFSISLKQSTDNTLHASMLFCIRTIRSG